MITPVHCGHPLYHTSDRTWNNVYARMATDAQEEVEHLRRTVRNRSVLRAVELGYAIRAKRALMRWHECRTSLPRPRLDHLTERNAILNVSNAALRAELSTTVARLRTVETQLAEERVRVANLVHTLMCARISHEHARD